MELFSLLLSCCTREPNYIYIYNAGLQAELIGASSMSGSSSQLGHTIIAVCTVLVLTCNLLLLLIIMFIN